MPGAPMSKGNQRQQQRHKKFYDRYLHEDRQKKSKARGILRHIKRYPWDKKAREMFAAFPDFVRKGLGGMPDERPSPVAVRKAAGVTLTALRKAPVLASKLVPA